jgi:hypothetical protein
LPPFLLPLITKSNIHTDIDNNNLWVEKDKPQSRSSLFFLDFFAGSKMPPREGNDEESPLIINRVKLAQPVEEFSFLRRVKMEIREQMGTALPTLQTMILMRIPWFISLRFVSEIGSEELAAAALATTLWNVTGLSLSVGLSSALTTLAGQAKGELFSRAFHEKRRRVSFGQEESTTEFTAPKENNTEPLKPLMFLYRGMLIQLFAVIPFGLWWIFGIKDVLIALGQHEVLAAMTEVSVVQNLVWAGRSLK